MTTTQSLQFITITLVINKRFVAAKTRATVEAMCKYADTMGAKVVAAERTVGYLWKAKTVFVICGPKDWVDGIVQVARNEAPVPFTTQQPS